MTGEPLGAMLTRLRERKGHTQLQVAEDLCQLSATSTVTRTEVSRWERELRSPDDFWLGWLSKVLEAPVDVLEEARERSKGKDGMAAGGMKTAGGVQVTNGPKRTRSRRDGELALVTLTFEHRATNVQLHGEYDAPEQATAAIGMFREMVTPETGEPPGGKCSEVPAAEARPRTPVPAGAVGRGGEPARVPMGIRYTSGPGPAVRRSDRSSATDGTWRQQ